MHSLECGTVNLDEIPIFKAINELMKADKGKETPICVTLMLIDHWQIIDTQNLSLTSYMSSAQRMKMGSY